MHRIGNVWLWALSGGWAMSAIPPLFEHKQTRGEWTENAANDPEADFRYRHAL
jgi:hypothetical protein